jgi:WXG100 family type VII secretion target
MGVLKVDFASMGDGVAALNRHWSQLQAQFADLDANVQQLMQVWDGEGQAAYLAHQARFRKGADQVHTSLKQLHGSLDTRHQDFRATEKGVRTGWS